MPKAVDARARLREHCEPLAENVLAHFVCARVGRAPLRFEKHEFVARALQAVLREASEVGAHRHEGTRLLHVEEVGDAAANVDGLILELGAAMDQPFSSLRAKFRRWVWTRCCIDVKHYICQKYTKKYWGLEQVPKHLRR